LYLLDTQYKWGLSTGTNTRFSSIVKIGVMHIRAHSTWEA
jgi:hypothetical protein